jgi:hypothetical protein
LKHWLDFPVSAGQNAKFKLQISKGPAFPPSSLRKNPQTGHCERSEANCFYLCEGNDIYRKSPDNIEAILYTALSSCWGWTRSADALQIVIATQTELPACGILHLLHNLYFDMIYGKTKINGCENIVKRVVLFYNTYKGIGETGSPRVQRQQINSPCIEP